eukprot:3555956-Rhodomonas_salina.1
MDPRPDPASRSTRLPSSASMRGFPSGSTDPPGAVSLVVRVCVFWDFARSVCDDDDEEEEEGRVRSDVGVLKRRMAVLRGRTEEAYTGTEGAYIGNEGAYGVLKGRVAVSERGV